MKKWYAFETSTWDIIGALEKQLGRSSILSRLQAGRTQPKERGSEMAENIFDLDRIRAVDSVTESMVRKYGVLVHSDPVTEFYRWRDGIYVLAPEPLVLDEPPTVDNTFDRAVVEAGFATEPLRHALQELYEVMYLRMLGDGFKGFTEREWCALRNAKHELGLD